MKGKGIKILAITGLLMVAMLAMIPSASALQDLKVKSDSLATLQSLTDTYENYNNAWYSYGTGSEPKLLKYDYGASLNTYGKSKTVVYVGSRKAIKIGDGQCVDFAKAVSDTKNTASTSWRRGRQVMDIGNYGDLARGTIIATFASQNSYSGHVAVFDSWHWTYLGNYQWSVDGFYVWDQNYVVGSLTGRHLLKQTSSGVNNANNYYVVQI
jgi:hypothetical protein